MQTIRTFIETDDESMGITVDASAWCATLDDDKLLQLAKNAGVEVEYPPNVVHVTLFAFVLEKENLAAQHLRDYVTATTPGARLCGVLDLIEFSDWVAIHREWLFAQVREELALVDPDYAKASSALRGEVLDDVDYDPNPDPDFDALAAYDAASGDLLEYPERPIKLTPTQQEVVAIHNEVMRQMNADHQKKRAEPPAAPERALTLRTLMRNVLDTEENIDRPAVVRIVRRCPEGVVRAVKIVPIGRYFGSGQFSVEQAAIDAAATETL